MKLGEPDASGRRAPVPIEGDTYELPIETIITAVSQEPDMAALGAAELTKKWLTADPWGRTEVSGLWTGGDNIGLGLATISIGQGSKAAESIHAAMRGEEPKGMPPRPLVGPEKIRMDHYEAKPRSLRQVLSPEERLARPYDEIDHGITAEQTLIEVTRCFSCGKCFACEKCWMFCQAGCFVKVPDPHLGHYYKMKLEVCDGCKKCADECPCGFLEMA